MDSEQVFYATIVDVIPTSIHARIPYSLTPLWPVKQIVLNNRILTPLSNLHLKTLINCIVILKKQYDYS